jgi:hypothetical protein
VRAENRTPEIAGLTFTPSCHSERSVPMHLFLKLRFCNFLVVS